MYYPQTYCPGHQPGDPPGFASPCTIIPLTDEQIAANAVEQAELDAQAAAAAQAELDAQAAAAAQAAAEAAAAQRLVDLQSVSDAEAKLTAWQDSIPDVSYNSLISGGKNILYGFAALAVVGITLVLFTSRRRSRS